MSKAESVPTANTSYAGRLSDLMLAAGVTNAPVWFEDILLPNWPMAHQMDAIVDYSRHLRFMDASQAGTGKTMPAQVHALLMAALGNKVVFTMPPKLIRQFMAEFKDFFPGFEKRISINHLDRGAVQKSKLIKRWDDQGWPDILLLSYDIYRQLNKINTVIKVPQAQWYTQDGESYFVQDGDGNRVSRDRTLRPFTKDGAPINHKGEARNLKRWKLKRSGYEVWFFDEAHNMCNPESIAWQATNEMAEEAGDDIAIYLMTGTPIPTVLENAYGLIKLINPGAYLSKRSFDRKHVIKRKIEVGTGNGKVRRVSKTIGYKGHDKVHEHLYRFARRVQKRDVLKLKDPLISSIPVKLAGPHKRLYDKILKDRFAILGDSVLAPDNDSALRQLALRLISTPEAFDESATSKIAQSNELAKAMDELVQSIDPGENKIIVFAHYKDTIKQLAARFAKYNPAVMYGDSSDGWGEVERFKKDDTCRMFFVNWQSGGEGLNLQVASHLIFYECPTSPRHAQQGIARADRNGQLNVVNVYFFRVLQTLYDRNFKRLLENEESNNRAVLDKHDLLYEQLKVNRKAA